MTELLVKEYLKTHSFQDLENDHGVVARSDQRNTKVSLNYDQIMVKSGDKLAEQCRGLILRPKSFLSTDEFLTRIVGETETLAWPMNRFYNLGDGSGAEVWWGDPELRVLEKLDGTMCIVYWDGLFTNWCVGTRAVCEADLPIKAGHVEIGDMTFAGLFWVAIADVIKAYTDDDALDFLERKNTYVFELTSTYNRVVVKYDVSQATLLAVRETQSGIELDPREQYVSHFINMPKFWSLDGPAAIQAFVEQADPAELEGCVVIDSEFRRLKIKSKKWVLASHAKATITDSWRNALEAIIVGTIDDVIPLVDKDVGDKLLRLQSQLHVYLKLIDSKFQGWRDEANGDRKYFASLVNASEEWASPYFQLLDNKAPDALTWARQLQANNKLSANTLDTILGRIKTIEIQ